MRMRISESRIRRIIREEARRALREGFDPVGELLEEGFLDTVTGWFKGNGASRSPAGAGSALADMVPMTSSMKFFNVDRGSLAALVSSGGPTLVTETAPAHLLISFSTPAGGEGKVSFAAHGFEARIPKRWRSLFSGTGRDVELVPPEEYRAKYPRGLGTSERVVQAREDELLPRIEAQTIGRLGRTLNVNLDTWKTHTDGMSPVRKRRELQNLISLVALIKILDSAHYRITSCFGESTAGVLFAAT